MDYFIFIFMHLADAFIQSDLHCIQFTGFIFLSALPFPGYQIHDLGIASAMLYYLSDRKAVFNTIDFTYKIDSIKDQVVTKVQGSRFFYTSHTQLYRI